MGVGQACVIGIICAFLWFTTALLDNANNTSLTPFSDNQVICFIF
jgi:hypothetical protein